MSQSIVIAFLLICNFSFAQESEKIYPLIVGGYRSGDTLSKQVFLLHPYVAEAVDDFGFETYLRTKYIQQHSVKLFKGDEMLIEEQRVKGYKFSKRVLQLVNLHFGLLRIEIFDVFLKKDKAKARKSGDRTVYFIR